MFEAVSYLREIDEEVVADHRHRSPPRYCSECDSPLLLSSVLLSSAVEQQEVKRRVPD